MGFLFVNFDDDAAPLTPTLDRYTPFLQPTTTWRTPSVLARSHSRTCRGTGRSCSRTSTTATTPTGCTSSCRTSVRRACLAFPVPWSDDSNVIFRTAGYTHIDGGFNATHRVIMDVFPEPDRGRTQPLDLRAGPADPVFRNRPRPVLLLSRAADRARNDRRRDWLHLPSVGTRGSACSNRSWRLSDAGVQVFVEQDQDATTKVQRGLRSRFAPRGRYSWQEESHIQFNRWLVQRYRSAWPQGSGR